jgi:SAM-dependent methyltransferase
MSFDVPADAYWQFMGRFSEQLATQFGAFLRLTPGQRVLDVGCGPGALTAVLAAELGAESVSAIDPEDPAAPDKDDQPGGRDGQLADILCQTRLTEIESTALTVSFRFESFGQWWAPFTLGVGPPGAYVASLSGEHRTALREAGARLLAEAPFTLTARSWTTRARV